MVIFEHDTPDVADSESLPDDPGTPDIGQAVELAPPAPAPRIMRMIQMVSSGESRDVLPMVADGHPEGQGEVDTQQQITQPQAFRRLPADAYQLNDAIERLQSSQQYRVLYHTAWRQPARPPQQSSSVHISMNPVALQQELASMFEADRRQSEGGDMTGPVRPAATATAAQDRGFEKKPLLPNRLINGVMELYENRYLHMRVDLLYQRQLEVESPDEHDMLGMFNEKTLATRAYRLQQSQRLRTDKLFYYDHPRFGVLVKAMPFELPQQQDDAESDGESEQDQTP
jgi:hypothetical protein